MGDMAMPALIEIEYDVAVAALGEILLDGRIHRLERGIQEFDLEMQFMAVLFDVRHQSGDVGFQRFDGFRAFIVQEKEAFDLNRPEALSQAVQIDGIDRILQFFDEDDGRTGGAALVASDVTP